MTGFNTERVTVLSGVRPTGSTSGRYPYDKEIQVTQKLSYPRRQTHLNENLANTGNPRSTSWGKIFSDELFECEDDELLSQLQIENNNIILAKRIHRGGAERKPTRLIRIKFNLPKTPDKVFCCSDSYSVDKYTPPPIKCSNCKLYRHIARDCRSRWACNRCAESHDRTYNCELNNSTLRCVYCGPGHGSNDPNCPKFLKEKEIIEISHERNVSYPQARIELDTGNRSYASTLRRPVNTPRISPQSNNSTLLTPINTPHTPNPSARPTTAAPTQNLHPDRDQINDKRIDRPPISGDLLESLSKHIEEEIKHAVENPTEDIIIITPTPPRDTVTCPQPLTTILNTISSTMDKIHNSSHNTEFFTDFMNIMTNLTTSLDALSSRIQND